MYTPCRYADKKFVDASRIWDKTHKNDVQRQIIIGLVCGGIAFFGLLYNLVCLCVCITPKAGVRARLLLLLQQLSMCCCCYKEAIAVRRERARMLCACHLP